MNASLRRLPLAVLYALAEMRMGRAARLLEPVITFPGVRLAFPTNWVNG